MEKTLSIRQANNGYIVSLSWCEKDGDDREFHHEEYVMKELPGELDKMFEGCCSGEKVESPEEKEKKSFDGAMKDAMKSMGDEDEENDE